MTGYDDDQDQLARKIRKVLSEFDFGEMDRKEVSRVLEKEAIKVKFESEENCTWIEGLGERQE